MSSNSAFGKEPIGWHSRGYLPHFDGGAILQSVTFRLNDSLPSRILEEWQRELAHLEAIDEDARDRELRKRIEKWLDQGHGCCFLREDRIAEIVQSTLLHFDQKKYRLSAWVIMPNHVHLILTPYAGESLARILHSLKSYTATKANQSLKRKGKFWQPEYYDRSIRDEKHYASAVSYVEMNPVKAGLCVKPADWRWGSAYYRSTNEMQ